MKLLFTILIMKWLWMCFMGIKIFSLYIGDNKTYKKIKPIKKTSNPQPQKETSQKEKKKIKNEWCLYLDFDTITLQ